MKPRTDWTPEELQIGAAFALAMERHPIPPQKGEEDREAMRSGNMMRKAAEAPIRRAVVRAGPSEPAQRAGEDDFNTPHAVRTGQTVRFKDPDDKDNPKARLGRVEHIGKHGIVVLCNQTGRAVKIPHGYYTSES